MIAICGEGALRDALVEPVPGVQKSLIATSQTHDLRRLIMGEIPLNHRDSTVKPIPRQQPSRGSFRNHVPPGFRPQATENIEEP